MSADPSRPPPFYCPACGKKHRADLSGIQGAPGAIARVTCARCETVMSLRIGDDGLPKCEILDQPSTAVGAAAPATHAPGGAMAKSSMSLSLLVAAVVAAVVSFGVGRLSAPGETAAAPQDEGRMATLEARIADLQRDLRAAQAKAEEAHALAAGARDGISSLGGSIQGGMQANASKVTAIEKAQNALGTAFETVQANYKALNGRIEQNYVNLRGVTKRVEALEGR